MRKFIQFINSIPDHKQELKVRQERLSRKEKVIGKIWGSKEKVAFKVQQQQ